MTELHGRPGEMPGPETGTAGLPAEFDKPAFKRPNASKYLEFRYGMTVAPATLAKLASVGGGPPFYKSVRTPLYPRDELDAWALARLGRLRRSTSDDDKAA